ncbi:MAG TPA: PfkB family carbohydrate kinase [Pyrinomonadaceae bacterium]|nr:PfkB family carbohydrate kinase [Pyrinomonadaceae bacterium]
MQFPFELRSDAELDAVGFGTNAVDFLIEVPEYPAYNSKVELIDYTRAAGGEVATTMAGLSRLSLRTSYIGRFGDDDAGTIGRRSLENDGVGLEYAETIAGARTQIAFIVIDARTGERTVIWKRDAKLAYTASEAPLQALKKVKALHFTPHDVDACVAMAREAKSLGVIVSADIDNVFPGAEELFPLVDIFIASSDVPARLFGENDARSGLKKIRERFGCRVAGVTLGSKGSLLLCEDTIVESSGYEVPGGCRDTTGAGDSFRVGLLYGLLRGAQVEEAAIYANAVAALKCRAVGARTALPTENELHDFLGS